MAETNGPNANESDDLKRDNQAFEQAMNAARAGDREAVGQMLELCRDYLLLIANQDIDRDMQRKLGASDLVQESMLTAQAQFERFEGKSRQDLLAWLRGILKNDVKHWRRHYTGVQKRAGEQSVNLRDSQAGRPEPTDAFHTPSTQAVAQEEEAMLNQALDKLPNNYQEIIRRRSFEDKSFVEIGKQLNCSSDAARKLWSRAIILLQEILANRIQNKN